jgi:hypothetical protein
VVNKFTSNHKHYYEVTEMKNSLTFALAYEKLGWFVLPADPIRKKPMVKWAHRRDQRPTPEEIRGWWKRFPGARIAIATGAYSGFDAVDVDGPEALEKLIAICGGNIPETIYQTTGRDGGGRHLLFKHNGHGLRPYQGGGLDLRTTGSIIIVAPSPHKSGKKYTWGHINPLEEGVDDLADWPSELIEYYRTVSDSQIPTNGHRKPITTAPVPAGERHQALVHLVGKWINQGLADETILLTARGWYAKLPDKTGFSEKELETLVQDLTRRYRKPEATAEDGARGKEKQADALTRIGETAELFKTPDGTLWARFQTNAHFECWPIQSAGGGFGRWLVSEYLKKTGRSPSKTAVESALLTLGSKAQYDESKKSQEVFTRVAEHAGCIYLDLADGAWRTVKISDGGWEIVNNPPVCFRRSKGMLPLPEPQPGGSLRLLDSLVNLGNEQNRKLILSWLVFTLNPSGPFPLLGLISQQGSGKSTTAQILRMTIDPNQSPIRSLPKNLEDLSVTAKHSWILGFDNLSYISDTFSDALCRLSTGGGYGTRALWTNDEEAVFWAKRPFILNGISDFIGRPDLLERTLIVGLPAIPPEKRLTEKIILERFKKVHPALLGAVLDAVVLTLKNLPSVSLPKTPRMADFAQWSEAAASAIEAKPSEMVSLLFEKQEEALESALDSPLPQAIFKLLESCGGKIEMTVGDLLIKLNENMPEWATRQQSWPKDAKALSGALDRIAPVVQVASVVITKFKKNNKGLPVLIERVG